MAEGDPVEEMAAVRVEGTEGISEVASSLSRMTPFQWMCPGILSSCLHAAKAPLSRRHRASATRGAVPLTAQR